MLPEARAIAKLRGAPYAIGDEEIAALREFFRQLRWIDERVTAASPTELYESQWALLGPAPPHGPQAGGGSQCRALRPERVDTKASIAVGTEKVEFRYRYRYSATYTPLVRLGYTKACGFAPDHIRCSLYSSPAPKGAHPH
jgi:hypothetical protein